MPTFNKEVRDELQKVIEEVNGKALAEMVREQIEAGLKPMQERSQRFEAYLERAEKAPPAAPVEREKGAGATRFMRAIACSALEAKRGSFRSPGAILKAWGDEDLSKIMDDAQTKALAASDAASGGYLVPAQLSAELIEFLRGASVVRRLGANTLPMPNGSIALPKMTAGATAAYQGENANITASQQTFGQVRLTYKKLTALVPISNDLVRFGAVGAGADAMVRDDVVRSLAARENQAFIRDNGTDSTPKGLLFWAASANKFNSAGTTLANMTTDLGSAIQLLMDNNIPEGRWAWILSPRNYRSLTTIQTTTGAYVFRDEMVQAKTLWGYPFGVTTHVPGSSTTGEMYLVNMADAVIGEAAGLIVDASTEAAYVDSSGNTIAAYSQDQTVIRAIAEHDFAMRRDESVAVIQNMSW